MKTKNFQKLTRSESKNIEGGNPLSYMLGVAFQALLNTSEWFYQNESQLGMEKYLQY